ncbi:hypothetical protein HJFPF1_06929 [Paramyrothecium foliicola]|nr:hypothetical protein HJFPF1_06929 [Paramyrothecium foliicola]
MVRSIKPGYAAAQLSYRFLESCYIEMTPARLLYFTTIDLHDHFSIVMAEKAYSIGDYLRELHRRTPLPRHEILQVLRWHLEIAHSEQLGKQTFGIMRQYEPQLDHCKKIFTAPDMTISQADDFCNKDVPVYVCMPPAQIEERPVPFELCLHALHNWLYKKWFRPYRSDIEWGQFVAKMIPLRGTDNSGKWLGFGKSPSQLISTAITLHAEICSKVLATCQSTLEKEADPEDDHQSDGIVSTQPLSDLKRDQKMFILQNIFKAVIILIDSNDYTLATSDVGLMPVYIVRTGVESGLSAPVTFGSVEENSTDVINDACGEVGAVRTTLAEAFAIIQVVVQQEVSAVGPCPNPFETAGELRAAYLTNEESLRHEAERFKDINARKPLVTHHLNLFAPTLQFSTIFPSYIFKAKAKTPTKNTSTTLSSKPPTTPHSKWVFSTTRTSAAVASAPASTSAVMECVADLGASPWAASAASSIDR